MYYSVHPLSLYVNLNYTIPVTGKSGISATDV